MFSVIIFEYLMEIDKNLKNVDNFSCTEVYIYIYIYIYIRGVFNMFPDFFVQAFKIVVDS